MTQEPTETIVLHTFDSRYGMITSGLWVPERNIILAGTEKGIVAIRNLDSNQETSYRLDSNRDGWITSISVSKDESILVVSRQGGLFTASLSTIFSDGFKILKNPDGGVQATIWRSSFGSSDLFFYAGTYGKYRRVRKTDEGYEVDTMWGHTHSIFGLAASESEYVAAGDYLGKISLTELKTETEPFQKVYAGSGVQGIRWDNNHAFAVISKSGGFYYFEDESRNSETSFKLKLNANLATGEGRCITISPDGNTILAGTRTELVQFDLSLNYGKLIDIPYCVEVWSDNDYAYVLTQSRFLKHKLEDITSDSGAVDFRQVKISLIGHTSAGKTTLCRHICYGDPGDATSTLGKNVFTWNVGDKKRVVFHDHGGQEAVIGTFIPFLGDSDFIFILFRRTDVNSLNRALEILEEVEETISEDIPIFFIETHIESQNATHADLRLKKLLDTKRIQKHLLVSPKFGDKLDELKDFILKRIDWNAAKVTIRSRISDNLRTIIEDMIKEDIPRTTVKELVRLYEEKTGTAVPTSHVKFILSNLANEGVVEYYPDIIPYVVLNDPDFNDLRSNLPNLVNAYGGLLDINVLQTEFSKYKDYVNLLDEIYAEYDFLVRGNGQRVFPQLLGSRQLDPSNELLSSLKKNTSEKSWTFRRHRKVQLQMTRGLFNLGLHCEDITKTEAIFHDKNELVVHYKLQETGSILTELGLMVIWTIGGTNKSKCQSFRHDFEILLESILGEPTDSPIRRMIDTWENSDIEFKRSLNSKFKVAKAIAAFGNTTGGNLILGVDDNTRAILGVENDYSQVSPTNRDGFGLRIGEIINDFMGSLHRRIIDNIVFEEIHGHDVCQIIVQKSPEPIFVTKDNEGNNTNLFFYRSANGTQKLDGDDLARYIRMHWPGPPLDSS